MTCVTCFNHCRHNCGNISFKFPMNLVHIHMLLCNLPLECILHTVCKLGRRDNLVQSCSINSVSKCQPWKEPESCSVSTIVSAPYCHLVSLLQIILQQLHGCLSIMCWCPVSSTPHKLGWWSMGGLSGDSSLVHKFRLSQGLPEAEHSVWMPCS